MAPVVADIVEQGLSSWWAPGLAFAADVVSFASPCVFPLVPGYLSFVAGGDTAIAEGRPERRPVVPILLFIGGFAAVFTALGAFTGAVTPILRSQRGIRLSGLVIIVFGVLMLLLGRSGASTVHISEESAEGRAVEEREERLGLQKED